MDGKPRRKEKKRIIKNHIHKNKRTKKGHKEGRKTEKKGLKGGFTVNLLKTY